MMHPKIETRRNKVAKDPMRMSSEELIAHRQKEWGGTMVYDNDLLNLLRKEMLSMRVEEYREYLNNRYKRTGEIS
jgi:hypothetical protein